jgi:hypothetical protein
MPGQPFQDLSSGSTGRLPKTFRNREVGHCSRFASCLTRREEPRHLERGWQSEALSERTPLNGHVRALHPSDWPCSLQLCASDWRGRRFHQSLGRTVRRRHSLPSPFSASIHVDAAAHDNPALRRTHVIWGVPCDAMPGAGAQGRSLSPSSGTWRGHDAVEC